MELEIQSTIHLISTLLVSTDMDFVGNVMHTVVDTVIIIMSVEQYSVYHHAFRVLIKLAVKGLFHEVDG